MFVLSYYQFQKILLLFIKRSCQEPKQKWIVGLFPPISQAIWINFVTPVNIIKSIKIFIEFYVAQKSTKIDKICG